MARDFRDYLVQKLIPIPKDAHIAKIGEKLSAYHDGTRWVIPGEISNEPAITSGPPPIKRAATAPPAILSPNTASIQSSPPIGLTSEKPKQAGLKNRYVVIN